MKKKRISNPRFLGALVFLGALGFLGSQNPGVMRWAHVAWLSLCSLLVLFPTMDAESPKAHYRLNLRRKWMLVFLGFPLFLGFLFSEYPEWAIVASLAILSQLAIDHKKKASIELKELRPIIVLLISAVILPIGGMLWFMIAAVDNEQMAVQQRLTEVYESQLDAAFQRLEESVGQQRQSLAEHADLPPARRFSALVQDSIADSILVLGENGELLYPATFVSKGPTSPEALALQTEVRSLLKQGAVSNALQKVEEMAEDTAMRVARDESGRLILPALQLFCLQSTAGARGSVEAPEMQPGSGGASPSMISSLREMVTDYRVEMPSSRRLFYLQALSRLGAAVEPWLGAETLAAELDGLVFPARAKGYWPVPGKDLFLLFSEDRRSVAVFKGSDLMAHLREQIAASSNVKGVRMELKQGPGRAWKARPFALLGDSWFIGLHIEGDDPVSETSDRRIVRYVWIGNMVIGGMILVLVLLVRSLLTQQRLTRMKNDFVATVTHELKTPLASTRMLVDTLLEGRCRGEEQQREYLELIARENRRLSRLIDNFLTFSRMERNKQTFSFSAVEPAALVRVAEAAVHERFDRFNCSLSVEVTEGLPSIRVDEDAMITVLLNLLDNAFKYSGEDKRIVLRAFAENQSVCFQVQDNGIGMERRELSKILERFYQVDQSLTRKAGGAGLGLSIVRFIVDAHGGKLNIESEPGAGSCFTVQIPMIGGTDRE